MTVAPDAPEPIWLGQLDQFDPDQLAVRHAFADAAKVGDWDEVLSRIAADPQCANICRPGGASWFAPLHQAAWNRAPVDIVEQLVTNGAWRTLRTAKGQTARDIAEERGFFELLETLELRTRTSTKAGIFSSLDEHFAALVESRIRPDLTIRLRYPPAEVLTEIPGQHIWFPIPGMYGGFSIRLVTNYLHVESWSRVVGGSGQIHVITTEGTTLVDEGFV